MTAIVDNYNHFRMLLLCYFDNLMSLYHENDVPPCLIFYIGNSMYLPHIRLDIP